MGVGSNQRLAKDKGVDREANLKVVGGKVLDRGTRITSGISVSDEFATQNKVQ